MRTLARKTASQIALRNCSEEMGETEYTCGFGEGDPCGFSEGDPCSQTHTVAESCCWSQTAVSLFKI